MNILNLSLSNLCNIHTNLSNGINKYTQHICRSVSMKPVVPYACDIDILYNEDSKKSVRHLLNECDVLHLSSWYFTDLKRYHPASILRIAPPFSIHLSNSFYRRLSAIGMLTERLPPIEHIWWYWYMLYINQSKIKGKKILLHYHGGDLRRVMSEKNKRFINNHKLKAVVDVPDLLPCLENTEWLPLSVPTSDELYKPPSKRADDVIKIVHSPTLKELRKTDALIKAVNKLKQKYDIELLLIENLPYKECLKLKRDAHIAFDNIEFGSYAGCSIEALCHEQPSLVYLNGPCLEQVRKISEEIGIESPFVQVGGLKQPSVEFLNKVIMGREHNVVTKEDYQSVYRALKQLIEDDSLRKEIGERGRKWVCKVHDVKVVARRLIKIYESLDPYKG